MDKDALGRLSKKLADEGKLIEAGWVAMRAVAIMADAPQIQLDEMRLAFMAGAQHLFASIFEILDDDQPAASEAELRRMELIYAELEAFKDEMATRLPTKGEA